ncbi:MAG: Xaa-Pro peptidase family protein [Devosia sp.]|nr:Xaa-Pro peptidase family protein [Devosia sp.]
MSKDDFAAGEFADRLRRVREAMAAARLDWLVAIHPVSIRWLTGSDAKSYQEFQCLLIGAGDEPLTVLVRAGEVNELEADSTVARVVGWGGGVTEDPIAAFGQLAARLKLIGTRVGLEVPGYYLHPHHHSGLLNVLGIDRVVEATSLIADIALVKSPAEIAYIRAAAGLADRAMREFETSLVAGASELQLAGRVYGSLLANGSGIAASPINLVSGPRSAFSHGAPTERVLRRGDFGNVEFGATARRYTATIGRQFVLGQASPRMLELYGVVRQASDAMIATIRGGVPAADAHEAGRAVIVDAGFEAYRVHLSGYGLSPGFPPSWAEPLQMIDGSPYLLQAGMVVTIEPPVFIGAEGLGARIIDNVLVTTTGAELLAAYPRELIVAG